MNVNIRNGSGSLGGNNVRIAIGGPHNISFNADSAVYELATDVDETALWSELRRK